jgi:glutamate/tyrosine decarboxylase-like PLP-dependent enzyme
MCHHLTDLEKTARLLEPEARERQQLLAHVLAYADNFLEKVATAPVYSSGPNNGRGLYDFPITEAGLDIEQALTLLEHNVDSVGINTKTGRYLGYIPGGGVFHSALGDYLAAITNRYAGLFFGCPGAVRMENMLLRWMADILGYPDTAAGTLTSGGSIANLTAIVAARDAGGIVGEAISKAVVYVTEHTHHCIDKALHVTGLGRCIRRTVTVDAAYRMDPTALEAAIVADKKAGLQPWLIVASAGTTNTGSVDPLAEIGDIAAADGLWYHVDGAYGGFFVLCPEGQAVLQGLDRSDSVVLDPHKTLFLPYGTGAVVVRDRQKLYASFSAEAAYLQTAFENVEEMSPAELSPELTRHFRGLRVWLPLKLLGVAPFRAALSEKIHLARYFYEQIQKIDGFEVGPYPDLSIVTYRYLPQRGDPDAFNQRLTQAIQDDGRTFVSPTRVEGKFVLRAAVVGYRTHLDEINEALEVISCIARQLADKDS